MYQHSNGSTTLPRDFRFHHNEQRPKTPEPFNTEEPQPPSAPRPTRLKVKRRNVSSLQAPTEQFLASVAAADVPIPTIELPQVNTSEDLEMVDREDVSISTVGLLSPQPYNFRFGSPPKTPMPSLTIDDSCRRPDWSMGSSSPEEYFQRPSSVQSNTSDFSDDSFYSGSRRSRPSEDGSCTSPESDAEDPFQFPSISKGKGKAILEEPPRFMPLNGNLRSKTRNDKPWSKAMSAHLWSTYLLYLQDPTVTPFRLGASCIPPEGVCHRVAREAKRSWKGPKIAIRRSARLGSVLNISRASDKSGSNTPTGEASKVYAQWPHSSSATRNHLRELCKIKNSIPAQRHRHLQSRSPTPFTRSNPYDQSRLRTPEQRSSFSTKDIALSLTTSTSESMQPNGLLANLARDESSSTPIPALSITSPTNTRPTDLGDAPGLAINIEEANRIRRLGSPFIARTYGPSSSQLLRSRASPPRIRSDTAGPLRSSLRFDNARSLNGTQKRRAQHSLEDELSPNGAVLRPSILDHQLFGTPLGHSRRVRSRGFSLGDEALRHRAPGIFQRSPPQIDFPPETEPTTSETTINLPTSAPKLLPSPFDHPRLGSPFSESGPSQTFPRRLFQDSQATIKRSSFATVHQTRHSIESFDFGEGPSLQSRLEQLDVKLKEIREREAAARK
ncbi:hypothetical protein G7Y89_g8439 [Cudoniella acicularis]|uniref:Uncharacterized protein n=1 Tax=Cudoniella acicularis TaxID=354080 RepID=A0A8H4RJ46_9HELO|nr:hypothetical protein G7Y89_g8439 [Cudoniella acicularis]